jgi:hypothetical protein
MLKHLDVVYQGHNIALECIHKKDFPPPQMYGSTAEDIDTLWRQGALTQNAYQMLQTWKEKCGIMVMGPRCLDCPLALKRNPRPGRPNVIETEPWLPAKERMYWDRTKPSRATRPEEPAAEPSPMEPVNAAAERAVLGTVERGPVAGPQSKAVGEPVLTTESIPVPVPPQEIDVLREDEEEVPPEEPEETPAEAPEPDPSAEETVLDAPSLGLDDDIIAALADD